MTVRNTTNRNILLFIAACFPIFFACSKNSSSDNPPATTDTLGTGWKKITMPELSYNDIFFINNNTGYVAGDNNIFRSTDGGNNWQKVYQASSGLVNIAMGSESNIVFTGASNNKIIFTKNGGASFDSVSISEPISDAFFVNATTVYAVGTNFWKSSNAGSTWTKVYNFPSPISGYASLHFLNDQYGWIAGIGGPYKTLNGGITWEQKPSSDFTFSSGNVFFTDINNGYVSDGNHIGKTSNGGNTWNKVFTGTTSYQDLHFITTDLGFITDGSYIYKTVNGGNTWSKEVVLPQKNIIELHFTDASHGWASGAGIVLKYQN
jgi:photosystem II stability/assembly factor-like uncharacterized protein